jgi:antitoxin component YwqK of YwqJK toxin-antitoxin module
MKNITSLIALLLITYCSFGQGEQGNVIYIIDSIPVLQAPGQGNEIQESDIADVTVVKNRDTLKVLGYDKFNAAIFIFTKEYRNRPDRIKQIPSSLQMVRKSDIWHFRGSPYTGEFVDYYYSGRKQGEGTFKDGKLEGLRKMYYQNGKVSLERFYVNGIENGLEKEYYEDGTLKQKGTFVNRKEEGIWEMYFPNGQVKQRSSFKSGIMDGESTVYYSSGKIWAVELIKNGKTTPDKRLEKINQVMNKGHEGSRNGDLKSAIKYYTKAIELDSTYAEAYFARGTAKLNNFKFDEAINDFDKALIYEPFHEKALSNRAFARIRKYQFGNSRQLSQDNGVTVLASKDNPGIPADEIALICNDLKQAVFLGDGGKMIMDAIAEFCQPKHSR